MNSFYTREQTNQSSREHVQAFKKMDSYLEKLGEKVKSEVENMEENKLKQYKQNLIKTKNEFDEMNEKRSDNAIKKAVHAHKKALEKECASFLQKSMEIGKVYDGLKTKLVSMQSGEQELEQQIDYLQKQIRNATNKNQLLKKELNIMQEWERKNKQRRPFHSKKPEVLCQKVNNAEKMKTHKSQKQLQQILYRTQQLKKRSEQRLSEKIDSTKQFLNSLVFEKSSLQMLFEEFDFTNYASDQSKLALIENLFSQEHCKQILYQLLFESN